MKRNGFSEEEANKRLASQPMTDAERAARAAVVLSNEGTEEDLVAKVGSMFPAALQCTRAPAFVSSFFSFLPRAA